LWRGTYDCDAEAVDKGVIEVTVLNGKIATI